MSKQEEIDLELLKDLSILYVEDDPALRERMLEFFRMIFTRVYPAEHGREGLDAFHRLSPDIVVTDIKMPVMDGLEMAAAIKEKSPESPVIVTTAFSETEYLVKAIEIGIDRYVQKPIDQDILIDALFKCGLPLIQGSRIEDLDNTIRHSLVKQLGNTRPMRELVNRVRQVAGTGFSVVLQGETGVGKSLVAGIIHDLSPRADNPFVTVDIGSIPETLVESELFGHKKGAFTGAAKDKRGFLEAASGGTVFFDDIQNMAPNVQSKLLRAVEEKKIYPLGSTRAVAIDFRIISATNIDFKKIVDDKQFREDLYYRLFEFDILIPPLRERTGDIPLLAQRFLSDAADELKKRAPEISGDAVKILESRQWPGNVRQLKNAIRRAVLLCDSDTLTAADLLKVIDTSHENGAKEVESSLPAGLASLALEDVEKWAIREALKQTGGKRMKAAQLLNIDYKRLTRKLEKYRIEVPKVS